MDYSVSFQCPVADWKSRGYDTRLQIFLEMTIQRTPRRRATSDAICKHSLVAENFKKLESETKIYFDALAKFNLKSAAVSSSIPRSSCSQETLVPASSAIKLNTPKRQSLIPRKKF
jgi:hypothetical protein